MVMRIIFLAFVGVVLPYSPPLTKEEQRKSGIVPLQNKLHYFHYAPRLRSSYKTLYVDQYGVAHRTRPAQPTVKVQATMRVSDTALNKAATIVGLMLKNAPYIVFHDVTQSHGVGIFTKEETLTVFPEFAEFADTPQCKGICTGHCSKTCSADGRKYSEMAGNSNTRSVILDENILCGPNDPYGHKENVLVHEFGHLVMKYMPSHYINRLHYVFNYVKAHHTWFDSYALTNVYEYWAEATSAFFMTIKRPRTSGPAGGMNLCDNFSRLCHNEQEARQNIKQHDPWLYDVLKEVYTNNRDHIASGLQVCQ